MNQFYKLTKMTRTVKQLVSTILLQHGGKGKWEKAHEKLTGQLKKKWKNTGNIAPTEYIASFQGIVAKIVHACTAVVKEKDSKEQDAEDSQKTSKLSSIMGKVCLNKKKVTVEG